MIDLKVSEFSIINLQDEAEAIASIENPVAVFWAVLNQDGELLYNSVARMNKDIIWLLGRIQHEIYKEYNND